MTYYRAEDLRLYASGVTASAAQSELSRITKSASGNFDVFLSHSFQDAVLVLGLKKLLEREALSVFVGWIEDTALDRASVSAATAARLRQRMKSCRSLVYATSRNASSSRWMPWELGYFDGTHGESKVAISPIATGATGTYVGEEYLGLYKTLEQVRSAGSLRPYVMKPSRAEAENVRSFVLGRGAFERITV